VTEAKESVNINWKNETLIFCPYQPWLKTDVYLNLLIKQNRLQHPC